MKTIPQTILKLEEQLTDALQTSPKEWDDSEWNVIIAALAGEIFDKKVKLAGDVEEKIFKGKGAVDILERCYLFAGKYVALHRRMYELTKPKTNCISINTKPKIKSYSYLQSVKRLKNAMTVKKDKQPLDWHDRINYNITYYKNFGKLPKEKYNAERERKN